MTLVQNLPVAIYRCAPLPDCRLVFINKGIENISGYPVSFFGEKGQNPYCSIVHPDDLELMKNTVQKRAVNGKFFDIEYRILHADGSVRWVHQKGQPVVDPEGHDTFFIGAIFDITQNKRALETFRLNEARLSALLELSQRTDAPLNEITSFALEEAIRLTRSRVGYLAFANEDESVLAHVFLVGGCHQGL